MAIITVSRQLGSYGDELCSQIASILGYRLVERKDIERRIVRSGFPKEKLSKFDDHKPGFFARFSKFRDEYLNALRTAVLSEAASGNCILLGRGSFFMLKDIPNHVSIRFVSETKVRVSRVQKQFSCSEDEALRIIKAADKKQHNFYKNYFNFDLRDPSFYNMVFNTGSEHVLDVAPLFAQGIKTFISDEMTEEGNRAIEKLIIGQELVNVLKTIYNVSIDNLSVTVKDKEITFHGIASSSVIVEQALTYASLELPGYSFKSDISVVQDFRTHRG